MLEIKVTVSCPDLVEAANTFTSALKGQPATPSAAPAMPTVAAPPATPAMPTSPAPVPPPPVPLAAAPSFTLEQLAHAGADLVTREPAKAQAAQALLQQFGINAVTDLPKERYGEFATALRGLGANI